MKKNFSVLRANWFGILILALLASVSALYWPGLIRHAWAPLDDDVVVVPLGALDSLAAYWQAVAAGQIKDLQPLRDLSLRLDFWFWQRWQLWTFYWHNLLLFLACGLLLFGLLRRHASLPRSVALVLVALFCFHPTFAKLVVWATARKYLLSALLILVATRWSLQKNFPGRAVGIVLCYSGALLAHPLPIGWPLWFACVHWRRQQARKILVALIVVAGVMALANHLYYSSTLYSLTPKYAALEGWAAIRWRLVMVARALMQIFVPLAPRAWSYALESWPTGVALLLAPVWAWGLGRVIWHYPSQRHWLLLATTLLLPVVGLVTNAGLTDPYLFLVAAILWVALAPAAYRALARRSVRCWVGFLLLVAFAYGAREQVQLWSDPAHFWQRDFHLEPLFENLKGAALEAQRYGRFEEALLLAQQLQTDYAGVASRETYCQILYQSPLKSAYVKLGMLRNRQFQESFACLYFVLALAVEQNNRAVGAATLARMMRGHWDFTTYQNRLAMAGDIAQLCGMGSVWVKDPKSCQRLVQQMTAATN